MQPRKWCKAQEKHTVSAKTKLNTHQKLWVWFRLRYHETRLGLLLYETAKAVKSNLGISIILKCTWLPTFIHSAHSSWMYHFSECGEASQPPTAVKNWPCRWARKHLVCINTLPLWRCISVWAWPEAGYRHPHPFCPEWQSQRLLSEWSSPFSVHHLSPQDSVGNASSFCTMTVFSSQSLEMELSVPSFLELLLKSASALCHFSAPLQSKEGNKTEMDKSNGEALLP